MSPFMGHGLDLTEPFEVGKTYLRVDGKAVTCIKASGIQGYETAQFDDHDETYARVVELYKHNEHFKPQPGDNLLSGHRYNRAQDRGRCTGSIWNQYAVIPEPRLAPHCIQFLKHVLLSYKDLLNHGTNPGKADT